MPGRCVKKNPLGVTKNSTATRNAQVWPAAYGPKVIRLSKRRRDAGANDRGDLKMHGYYNCRPGNSAEGSQASEPFAGYCRLFVNWAPCTIQAPFPQSTSGFRCRICFAHELLKCIADRTFAGWQSSRCDKVASDQR